jgi:hypothetical protein
VNCPGTLLSKETYSCAFLVVLECYSELCRYRDLKWWVLQIVWGSQHQFPLQSWRKRRSARHFLYEFRVHIMKWKSAHRYNLRYLMTLLIARSYNVSHWLSATETQNRSSCRTTTSIIIKYILTNFLHFSFYYTHTCFGDIISPSSESINFYYWHITFEYLAVT